MFKFVLESLFLASKKTTFSAKSVRIENRRGDKIVDELELEVADVVGVGVVGEFKVGEQKLCRREFGGGRGVEHPPLVVVVSAPQLQLQFSTGNTAAAHWTQHLLTQSQFSTVKIALIVSCPNNV